MSWCQLLPDRTALQVSQCQSNSLCVISQCMTIVSPRTAASVSVLDDLVLQHLRSHGFEHAAAAFEQELGGRLATLPQSAVETACNRPSLSKLLISSAAPMYAKCYAELRDWVEASLEAYRPELRRVLFPLFVASYLALVSAGEREHASIFFNEFHEDHALCHRSELNSLAQITAPEHLACSEFATRLMARRWEVQMSAYSLALLIHSIEQRRLAPLLAALNERVVISITRQGHSSDVDDGTAGSWTAAAASAQMWNDMSESSIQVSYIRADAPRVRE